MLLNNLLFEGRVIFHDRLDSNLFWMSFVLKKNIMMI